MNQYHENIDNIKIMIGNKKTRMSSKYWSMLMAIYLSYEGEHHMAAWLTLEKLQLCTCVHCVQALWPKQQLSDTCLVNVYLSLKTLQLTRVWLSLTSLSFLISVRSFLFLIGPIVSIFSQWGTIMVRNQNISTDTL